MRRKPKKLFINIAPQFPYSRGWVVTFYNKNNVVKGILTCANKAGLIYALEEAIPDDGNNIDVDFQTN